MCVVIVRYCEIIILPRASVIFPSLSSEAMAWSILASGNSRLRLALIPPRVIGPFLNCSITASSTVMYDTGSSCFMGLIGSCFWARPLVLDAARVKENCFSLSLITAPSCESWRRASTGKFCRVSRGVRPPQGRVGGPWRRWRAVRVEIAQPQSGLGPNPRAKSPPPGKPPNRPAKGRSKSKCQFSLLTLLAEPDLTNCEMGDLNGAQPNRAQNSLFALLPAFGTPAS